MNYIPSSTVGAMWHHQEYWLEKSALNKIHAVIWDTRCGKSRFAIDTSVIQYEHDIINGVLVVSWPAGVKYNWEKEFKTFIPERIDYSIVVWRKEQFSTLIYKQKFQDLIN